MERNIRKIKKNDDTDIVVIIDNFLEGGTNNPRTHNFK